MQIKSIRRRGGIKYEAQAIEVLEDVARCRQRRGARRAGMGIVVVCLGFVGSVGGDAVGWGMVNAGIYHPT